MKTTIHISIECNKLDVLDLAANQLKIMLLDAAEHMCTVAKKDDLKINILSD